MLSTTSSILFLAIEGADWQQIIVLLLFLFFGLGKAILDKVRGARPDPRQGRRAGTLPSTSPSQAPTAAAEPAPRDVRQLWDEVMAGAREEPPETQPRPAAPPPEVRRAEPLGLDLIEVGDELPSHHEGNFESHAAPGGVEGRQQPAPLQLATASGTQKERSSRGAELHELIGNRDAWQRAVVLSEVLGTPLALRKAGQVPGLQ